MKSKTIALALSLLLTMPCVLRAEEIEIQLMEVVEMSILPGDNPLDDSNQSPKDPPRPRDFRATIDGTTLMVSKQEQTIPSAQAVVVNTSTGNVLVNQSFTSSLTRQISVPGIYALRIHTAGGDLVGQFIVQ